jgi:hypothetical protein
MERQALIERFYDGCEFPHCERNVYGNVYYGLADALNMEIEEFKKSFPDILSPVYHGYKLNQENCASMTCNILENSRIDILQGIVDYVEYYANLEYQSDIDDGYDSY